MNPQCEPNVTTSVQRRLIRWTVPWSPPILNEITHFDRPLEDDDQAPLD